MSLDLFRATLGIDIQNDDLTSNAYILQGIGAPGADGAEQDDAPIGSIYMRTDAITDELQVYFKFVDNNAQADWRLVASKNYIDTAVQGISWREPVRYLDDTTATIAAAVADMNADDQLGTEGAVAAGDRILFDSMGAGDGGPNVYIVSGSTGNWTLTEDTNDETDGDAVLVNEGSHADEQWIFDGTNWIQFGGAGSATELGYIRDFIGKDTSGALTPDYPSNDLVLDGQNLEHEIGRLDDAVGNMTFTTPNVLTDYSDTLGTFASPGTPAAADVTTNLQAIDDAIGNGNITNTGGNNPISDDASWNGGTLDLTDMIDELNTAVGDRTYTNDYIITDGQTVAGSLNALDGIVGDIDNTSAWTAGGLLTASSAAGNNIQETLDAFNQEIGDIVNNTTEVTGGPVPVSPTVTVIDTVSATEVTEIKWMLQVKDGSGNRRAMEIHALTDGTTVDYNRYSVLRLGSTGSVGVNVAINTGNIELSIEPANALTYTVKRISTSYLA